MSETTHSSLSPFARLLGYLLPERRELWMVLVYAVGVGVLNLAVPITAMAVVNTAALSNLVQQLLALCVALLVCLVLSAFLQLLQQIVVEYIQRRVFVRVVATLADRLPRAELKAFDQQYGPELVNRFFDILTIQKAASTLLMDGVSLFLQVMIGLTLLAFYHPLLLAFDAVLIAGLLFMTFVLGRGAVGRAIRESRSKYAVSGWMEELARNPIAFKLSGGPEFAKARADELTQDYLAARASHFHVLLRQIGFALFLQVFASTSLLALGGYMVIHGQLTLGQLVAAEMVVTLVVASFSKFGKHLESYYDMLAAVDKVGHMLDLPVEHDGISPHEGDMHGAKLEVRDLTFAHTDAHDAVIHDLSFVIAPGERVAVVGPNGAGKSTLVDLLFGLRTPQSGWVQIDGIDVRDLKLDALRKQIAIVKGVEIFEGTILENVCVGRADVTLADARSALDSVDVLETILEFSRGIHTHLTAGGHPLSLGAAERVVLARAIAGRPRFLVLDETLDNMDREIRDRVWSVITGRDTPWTLLVVTHNDDVAQRMDRQIRLERTPSQEQS